MSTTVLIIAGLFVLAGIGLVVLSILLGRRDRAANVESAEAESGEASTTFIDEPLQTDISTELGAAPRVLEPEADVTADEAPARETGKHPEEEGEPPAAATEEAPHTGTEQAALIAETPTVTSLAAEEMGGKVAEGAETVEAAEPGDSGETRDDEAMSPPSGTGTEEQARAMPLGLERTSLPEVEVAGRVVTMASQPENVSLQQVSFNFRVQLGFKYLTNNLAEDAIGEFRQALSLTDDPEAKLELLVEIGNALRAQGLYAAAADAYTEANDYAHNDALKVHLARAVAEMTELQGGAGPAGGSGEDAGTIDGDTGDPGLDKEE